MKKSILQGKPYVTAKITKPGSPFELYVNGYVVFTARDFDQTSVEVPINHALKSGENDVEINLWHPERVPETTQTEVEILVKDADDKTQKQFHIMALSYRHRNAKAGLATIESSPAGIYDSLNHLHSDDKGDVKISTVSTSIEPPSEKNDQYEGIRIKRTLDMPINLPRWKFFDSEDFPDVDAMPEQERNQYRKDVFSKPYEQLKAELQRGDINAIMAKMKEKTSEYDAAFFYEPGTMEKRMRDSLAKAMTHGELMDFTYKQYLPDIFPNRKLARESNSTLRPIIRFYFSKEDSTEYYDFIFRREKGQWIITR